MKRKFDITMHVPLGRRHGTLLYSEDNSAVSGILEILGNKSPFTGSLTDNGIVEFTGKIKSILHSFRYIARGRITGSHIKLDVIGSRYSFCITGEEISI